jgi:hypothetical protein
VGYLPSLQRAVCRSERFCYHVKTSDVLAVRENSAARLRLMSLSRGADETASNVEWRRGRLRSGRPWSEE